MSSSSSCCVFCPDCGQGFVSPENNCVDIDSTCHQCRPSHRYNKNNSDEENLIENKSFFKKPLLTTLFESIWNPFKGSSDYGSRMKNNLPSTKKQMVPLASIQRQATTSTINSMMSVESVVSRTSWTTGLFSWNWKNFPTAKKRKISKNKDEGSQTVPDYRGKRTKRICLKDAEDLQNKFLWTRDQQEQYETSCYTETETDSDRLNLKLFLEPPISKKAQIQAWLDKLEVNMLDMNLERTEDSVVPICPCQNGKLEIKKNLILNYMAKSGEEMKKLQNTIEEHADNREKEFIFLTSLSKTSEELKAEITECAKTQRDILEKFVNQSSRMDLEFDIEERMNALHAKESLQYIQEKLSSDIVKKESRSMIELFNS